MQSHCKGFSVVKKLMSIKMTKSSSVNIVIGPPMHINYFTNTLKLNTKNTNTFVNIVVTGSSVKLLADIIANVSIWILPCPNTLQRSHCVHIVERHSRVTDSRSILDPSMRRSLHSNVTIVNVVMALPLLFVSLQQFVYISQLFVYIPFKMLDFVHFPKGSPNCKEGGKNGANR